MVEEEELKTFHYKEHEIQRMGANNIEIKINLEVRGSLERKDGVNLV